MLTSSRARIGGPSHPLSNSMSKGMSAFAIRLPLAALQNSEIKFLWFLTHEEPKWRLMVTYRSCKKFN